VAAAALSVVKYHYPSFDLQKVSKDVDLSSLVSEGPIRRTREGGSEWEPIKILLEGDGNSNKMNTASNTRL
jgi:competence protein ComGC